jgi:hypothetical protein
MLVFARFRVDGCATALPSTYSEKVSAQKLSRDSPLMSNWLTFLYCGLRNNFDKREKEKDKDERNRNQTC